MRDIVPSTKLHRRKWSPEVTEMNDDELLEALGAESPQIKVASLTAREERIIAGFEDILRFQQSHGRVPQHGDDRDIFERLYATRLDQIRKQPDSRTLLAALDSSGLLGDELDTSVRVDDIDEDELLEQLGQVEMATDITQLRHVRSFDERMAAEEIANRIKCQDFATFKPLFDKVQRELKSGERKTIALDERSLDEIRQGIFFIIGGQIAYIAEENEEFKTAYDRRDMRLRVVYDNGTESDLLQRSLQRALHRDKIARLISEPNAGPLFAATIEPDDIVDGTIYVLRSLSDHPFVAEHRELIHKIGVTGGKVETRIAGADKDPTYLLSSVEIVSTYKLVNLNRTKLENLIHRLFLPAQLDLTILDRFGNPVKPREWFLVPLHVIDEAVQRIRDGSISDVVYEPKTAKLVSFNT